MRECQDNGLIYKITDDVSIIMVIWTHYNYEKTGKLDKISNGDYDFTGHYSNVFGK